MFPISWIIDIDSASVSSTHTALIHRAIKHLTLLENAWIRSLPRNFTIWTFDQKCFSGAYDIQNVLVLVSRGLRLIAWNMHYAKFTLWTPKLQILAQTLIIVDWVTKTSNKILLSHTDPNFLLIKLIELFLIELLKFFVNKTKVF